MEKCPKCGLYMDDGYIHAGRGAFFSKDKHRFTVFVNEKVGDKKIVGLWKEHVPAYFCRSCGIIVLKDK